MTEDEEYSRRLLDSIALGMMADDIFEYECRRLNLPLAACYIAPLTWLGAHSEMETHNRGH